jgi:hypothetical protein
MTRRFLLLILVILFPCAAQPQGRARQATPRPAGARTSSTTSTAGNARAFRTMVVPNLRRTSFVNPHSYFIWTNYYYYLSRQFDLNPMYFRRFYYNREPLVTPEILKLTLSAPMRSSSEMLGSIDELEAMFENSRSGNLADRQAILEKCEKIRELAKAIRNNQTLSYIDVGKGKNLHSEKERYAVQQEDLQKLREMAVDLNRQLKDLYNCTSTATVSVDSYREPSLESLAKGIEKMCKAIENSSKRM